AARPDRGPARGGAARPHVAVGPGEGRGRSESPGREARMSELEGRGAARTEERGTSDEGRQRLKAPRKRAGGENARVAVIGGGLAGITAAIALAESGADVTLLEARPRLGGATSSFTRDRLVVDTGQHVFLGCCAAYRGLLARRGKTGAVTLQDRFDVTVLRPGPAAGPPRQARLRRTSLPGPLH